MAYTTINKSTDYFNTKIYTGNGSDNHAITGVGFQPDWVWLKNRATSNSHYLQDALRGATKNLKSDATDAEETRADSLKSFDSDGFTLGTETAINGNGNNLVSWNWKAGTTGSGSTTGAGTAKTYNYSVNTTAGFSIVKYVGNGTAGQQIPHHLGAVPHFIMLKPLDRSDNWRIYHKGIDDSAPEDYFLKINSNAARVDNSDVWNDTAPTSTYFTIGSNAGVGANDEEFIAYCFTEKNGYSKFNRYTANGNSDGTFVYTGLKPAIVHTKVIAAADNWALWDNKRGSYNVIKPMLRGDAAQAESNNGSYKVDFLSNGFKWRSNDSKINGDGTSYIYVAFGQSVVGSNNTPTTAK